MGSAPGHPGRRGRLVWLGVAVVVALLLGASFVLAGRARTDAEAQAQLRAERYAVSGLAAELTPDQVQADITGQPYRRLLQAVQAGVLADGDVVRVRLWRPDGDLIFSTAGRDEVAEVVATDVPEISRAAQGETVSVVVDDSEPPRPGLVVSQEDLFVTYVPLRFANEPEVAGVVEVDQRLAAIESDVNRLWLPIRVGLGVALVTVVILFFFSLQRSRTAPAVGWAGTAAADDRRLRDAEDRALAAERAAREAEQRLAEAERAVEERAAATSPEDRARLEELELKLRAEEAEREQLRMEVERLRLALSEREGELAAARDQAQSGDADRSSALESARRAEQRVAELEAQAAEAVSRASQAETRAAEAEASAAEAERASEGAAPAEGPTHEELDRLGAELAEARAEVDVVRLEAQRAHLDLDASNEDLERVRIDLQEARGELDRVRGELEGSRQETADAQRLVAAMEKSAEAAAAPAPDVAELESRLAEIESRRAQEIADLQHAQEALANTQLELIEAARKLRASEERVADLEARTPAAPSAAEEAPLPRADAEAEWATFGRAEDEMRGPAPVGPEGPASEPERETDAPAAETEAPEDESSLSLRERLARAAAARHRTTQPPE